MWEMTFNIGRLYVGFRPRRPHVTGPNGAENKPPARSFNYIFIKFIKLTRKYERRKIGQTRQDQI